MRKGVLINFNLGSHYLKDQATLLNCLYKPKLLDNWGQLPPLMIPATLLTEKGLTSSSFTAG